MMSQFVKVDIGLITDRTLSPVNKVVFILLCTHADKKTHTYNCNVDTIAEEAGCGKTTVRRSLYILEAYGLIERRALRDKYGRFIRLSYQIIGKEIEQ